jgi:CMP-N,N'-diacetyllegionaminic acid synthase
MNDILLTICARGGSKGVKGKNLRMLNGYPLIYYTIKQALNWRLAKRIVVSTDSQEIAGIAKKYGAEVPFIRPAKLAKDSSPKLPVIKHAIEECEKIFQEKYDIIMDLDPTSPIRTIKDLNDSLNLFLQKNPENLFSVIQARKNPYFNVVELGKNNCAHLSKRKRSKIVRRQDGPLVYEMNASIYIYSRKFFLNKKNISPIGKNSMIFEMSENSGIDIDREIDFHFIEFLLAKKIISI